MQLGISASEFDKHGERKKIVVYDLDSSNCGLFLVLNLPHSSRGTDRKALATPDSVTPKQRRCCNTASQAYK